MMDVQTFHDKLKSAQEKRGYFFNRDHKMVMELLEGLLTNRERYGYQCCPCRLASGNQEGDKDITCPCDYRAPDVKEYGACFCALYVSKEWNEDLIPHLTVPERRPEEKQVYI